MQPYSVIAKTPEETEAAGAALAAAFLAEDPTAHRFVALRGDLGAGKTVFVRGFASVLSPGNRVKSPTYTLVNEYRKGKTPLFHFDLYRAEDEDALASIGIDDYIAAGHCIVEWSEYMNDFPDDTVFVTVTPREDGSREIAVKGGRA